MDLLRFALGLVADLVRGRTALLAEKALLRQQLIVAQRKIHGRVRWKPWQRFTKGVAARLGPHGARPRYSFSRRRFSAGTGLGSARSGDDALGP